MAVYFRHLADFCLEAVSQAITQAIRTSERWPSVAMLRQLAGSYQPPRPRQAVNDNQLTEFSVTEVEEAKRKLADLAAGIGMEVA